MPILSYLYQLFDTKPVQAYIHCYAGRIGPSNVPGVRAITSVLGAPTTTSPDCNATAVKRKPASAPSMTSREPSWTAASARSCTGFLPRFCCAYRVHPGALQKNWASISVPVIASAGGCVMPPCLMKCIASSMGLWKRMTSTTPRATRVGQTRWPKGPGPPSTWPAQKA